MAKLPPMIETRKRVVLWRRFLKRLAKLVPRVTVGSGDFTNADSVAMSQSNSSVVFHLEHPRTQPPDADRLGKWLSVLTETHKPPKEGNSPSHRNWFRHQSITATSKRGLRSMSVADLSFGDVPFVKLKHRNEKNRQRSTLPLWSDLAAELRAWIAGKSPTDSVFHVPTGLLCPHGIAGTRPELPKRRCVTATSA